MADGRIGYLRNQQLALKQILEEAQNRWLRPTEICEILRNYQSFDITVNPPVRPPAGSLFLFDRKALRYFRKDGHRWRKKRDGKTVKEAHEKLKAGSVDVLHCYYAHGEGNENFQRRSYWMLDGKLEHIVFVHYREVKEGFKFSLFHLVNVDAGPQVESPQTGSGSFLFHAKPPDSAVQISYASSPNTVDWNGNALSSEIEDADSVDDPEISSLSQLIYGSVPHSTLLHTRDDEGGPGLSRNHLGLGFVGADFDHSIRSSIWPEILCSSGNVNSMNDHKLYFGQPCGADFIPHKLTDAKLDADSSVQDVTCGDISSSGTASSPRAVQVKNHSQEGGANKNELGELKKLDSFGRWMDKEIGGDCSDSLMASDSGNYWNTLDPQNDNKEVSSLSRHMQLDIGSLAPSLSQEQLFSILDFSPDWAYSAVGAKVLITGTFLGDTKKYSDTEWCCMFGEIEVSAEVLTNSVIRCQAPLHACGRVPFYITCSNRLACSEVREFDYRETPPEVPFLMFGKSVPVDEVRFQIHFAKMLCTGLERKWICCSAKDCDGCKIKNNIYSTKSSSEHDWKRIEEGSMAFEGNCLKATDLLIQNLLKDRLCEWLACKVHEGGRGPHVLDDEGQGVIHLAAALGYEWAMGPIVAAGVSPTFRDARGRSALHWASYFGREETVISLVKLGAAPGAVEDPILAFPEGRTAADLASSRGHKGIAGYLAEAALTAHLKALTVNENTRDSVAAIIAVDEALVKAEQIVVPSLRSSLDAVRKSVHAAELIKASFRARSFREKQLPLRADDVSEASVDLVALGFLNKVQKMSHFHDYLHSAAIKIQQKYRGWKGRKEFLKIRSRIVKLQAHVRGHQVRKQYKKVVWCVGIVEKAILRWRRKRRGFRGFSVPETIESIVEEPETADEYDHLRIGRKLKFAGVEKALARVHSMHRNPEARDQYMRLVSKFQNFKVGSEDSSGSPEVGILEKKRG